MSTPAFIHSDVCHSCVCHRTVYFNGKITLTWILSDKTRKWKVKVEKTRLCLFVQPNKDLITFYANKFLVIEKLFFWRPKINWIVLKSNTLTNPLCFRHLYQHTPSFYPLGMGGNLIGGNQKWRTPVDCKKKIWTQIILFYSVKINC